jgi:hypothetical protein
MAFGDGWGHDGLTYSGKEMRELVKTLTGALSGVTGASTAMQVTQQTVAAATVKVAAGGAVIPATGAGLGGSYQVYNDADLTSPTISPTAANGRKDRLIIRVTAGVPALEVVQGVAAASPAEPAITGDNYLELALITLPASTTNITDAMITDRRVFLTTGIQVAAWTSYSPTLAWSGGGGSIGNGTLTGRYTRIGRTVQFEAVLTYGTTTVSGTGRLRIGLPVTAVASQSRNGGGSYLNSGVDEYGGLNMAIPSSGSYAEILHSGGYVTNTSPITFGSADVVNIGGTYEAAS